MGKDDTVSIRRDRDIWGKIKGIREEKDGSVSIRRTDTSGVKEVREEKGGTVSIRRTETSSKGREKMAL